MSDEASPKYEPFSETPQPNTNREEAERAWRELVRAYRATFDSEKGRIVLRDLHKKFRFGRWPAEDTEDERKIARRVFMHGPLHHIEDMRLSVPNQPKRKKVNEPKQ